MFKAAIVRFDTTAAAAIQNWPSWLHLPMTIITTVGQPAVLGVVAAIIAFRAWQLAQLRIVYSLSAGVLAMGANMLLKHYIHRTRPDTVYVSNMFFKSSSFPSGHAFSAAVLCGLFSYLAFKYLPGSWHIVVPILLGVFTVAVGVSRVYLGAHYPTDVIAGWILGALAAIVIIICFRP
jgi:undecaprenyl-diphosphatase